MIQDGARRRYMVPLALQKAGILERVYADWFVRESSIESKVAALVSRFKPGLGRRMLERSCSTLDPARVMSNWPLALSIQLKMRRFALPEDSFLYASHRIARWVLKEGFADANVLYGFIRNAGAPRVTRSSPPSRWK
jgi:hypothetical protein